MGKLTFSSAKGVDVESYITALFKKEYGGHFNTVKMNRVLMSKQMIFANIYWTVGCQPVILYRNNGPWQLAHPLHNELWGKDWEAVLDIGSGKYYAILDHVIEGPGHKLYILYSGDKGKTWRINGILEKNYYWSEMVNFKMDQGGRGSVILYLDDDYGYPTLRPGLYIYQTRDGGKTWSKPEYRAGQWPMQTTPDNNPDFNSMEKLMTWLRAKK